MNTLLLPANAESIAQAARLMAQGEIVAIPTETVYGIAGSAFDGAAVKKIFEAKGRPQDNPLIVHVDSLARMEQVVQKITPRAEKLAKAFWPGPLSMILPRGPRLADEVCAGLDTVAVRMPSDPVAHRLVELSGLPFAAPSANRSGSPSPTTAQDVLADMDGRLPLILDGGACKVGVESTVINISGPQPVLLRPGYITQQQLAEALGEEVLLAGAITHKLKEGEIARSPGMKYKHYAPKANVVIVRGSFEQYAAYVEAHKAEGVFCLCFAGEPESLPVPCVTYGSENDPAAQAHDLFRALRELDEEGATQVYARCPGQEGVALAVYNRLLRAAGFQVVEL